MKPILAFFALFFTLQAAPAFADMPPVTGDSTQNTTVDDGGDPFAIQEEQIAETEEGMPILAVILIALVAAFMIYSGVRSRRGRIP